MNSSIQHNLSALPGSLAPLYQRYARWLPSAVALLLTVLIARVLAELVWVLVPAPAAAAWQPAPAAASGPNPDSQLDVNRIAAAQLFGHYQPPSKAATDDLANAPATSLNLTLMGVYVDREDKKLSRALIFNTKEEKPYAVGDAVDAGVTVTGIFADRVALLRNGRTEMLLLDKDRPNATPAPAAVAAADTGGEESLAQIRSQMLQDPSKAADYIRVQPAPNPDGSGQMGYRIYPGRDRAIFNRAGLHPGDVVTAVNGTTLDDPSKSLQLLSDLSQAGEVTLTITRGGQPVSVNLNLSQ